MKITMEDTKIEDQTTSKTTPNLMKTTVEEIRTEDQTANIGKKTTAIKEPSIEKCTFMILSITKK